MTIVAMPDAHTAAAIVVILTMMSIVFSGVLQTPDALPGFWIFMYRASPFTYWIGGIVATELHGRQVQCADRETRPFDPPAGMTCQQYFGSIAQKLAANGGSSSNSGYLVPGTENATSGCKFCPLNVADEFLAPSKIFWSDRWRNFGIVWVYVVFNIFMAVVIYYMFRVRKSGGGLKNFKLPWAKKTAKKTDETVANAKTETESAASNGSNNGNSA